MFGKKEKKAKHFNLRSKARKQKFTSAPMEGKKKDVGHSMGGLFGYTPKKPDPDATPRTRASEARVRQAREKRLSKVIL